MIPNPQTIMFNTNTGSDMNPNNNETLAHLTQMMMMNIPQEQQPVIISGGLGEVEEYGRVAAWSERETRDLIAIRGELEGDFVVSKRNKGLWEVVGSKMKELGYARSGDQCKCKWKNLVTRYKGKETSGDSTRSFPFFDELHTLFTRTSASTPQTPFDPEATSSQSKSKKRVSRTDSYQSLEEISEDEDEKNITKIPKPPRKKPEREKHPQTSKPQTSGNSSIQEILQNFFQQQQTIDDQWRQLMDKHAYERQLFDQEWRQSMEKLEIERMRMERSWREKEEQRKIREESRAERRDALLTLLLNKLVHEQ